MYKYAILALVASVSATKVNADANTEQIDWAALAKKAKGAVAGFQGSAQENAVPHSLAQAHANSDQVDWAALAKKAKGALPGF